MKSATVLRNRSSQSRFCSVSASVCSPQIRRRSSRGGADGEIFGAQSDAVLHGACGMPHLQLQIPQDIEHRFHDAFDPWRDLPRGQKQQVHIGMRRHLAAAIAADSQDGEMFAFGRVGAGMQDAGGNQPRALDQPVRQMGIGLRDPSGTRRIGFEPQPDRGAPPILRRRQDVNSCTSDRHRVGRCRRLPPAARRPSPPRRRFRPAWR